MKQWTINLDTKSIQRVIDELNKYESELDTKISRVIAKCFNYGIETVNENSAGYSTNIQYTFTRGQGVVTATFTVTGEQLLFIEFGTGVHFNGHPHSSPHPDGVKLGYTIGDYSNKHNGLKDGWVYFDTEEQRYKYTNGIKALMPVYKADLRIILTIVDVAKEVFGAN